MIICVIFKISFLMQNLMQNFEKNLTRLIKLASIHIYNNACGIHDT